MSEAREAWRAANAELDASIASNDSDRNCYGIQKMMNHLRNTWKVMPADLHDAVMLAKIATPSSPSMLAYVSLLWEHCGSAEQMQHQQRRKTCAVLKSMQKCFQRGGVNFGTLSIKGNNQQAKLAERIARIMGELMEQAKRTEASDAIGAEEHSTGDLDDDEAERRAKKPRLLHLQRREYGCMPQEATVSWMSFCLTEARGMQGLQSQTSNTHL